MERELSGQLVIGRDTASDVVLQDGDASRRHASVSVDGPTARVEDLGSTNGTYVNGERLEGARSLSDGDQVRIGSTVIEYRDAAVAGVAAEAPGAGDATRIGTPKPDFAGGEAAMGPPPEPAPPSMEPTQGGAAMTEQPQGPEGAPQEPPPAAPQGMPPPGPGPGAMPPPGDAPPPGMEMAPTQSTTPKSDQERRAILGQQLQNAAARGLRVESQSEFQAVLVEGKPINHTLHGILTVITCLIWGPVYIVIALTGGEKKHQAVVDEFGNVQWQNLGKARS